jgi:hypothetical protein
VAKNSISIGAAPEDVYAVLNDAASYPHWVVGAKRLRGIDPGWPRVGTRFHHQIGAGPLTLDDSSKILRKRKNREVDLEVRFRPVGVATVQLRLRPQQRGRATLVTMKERATRGPAGWIWSWPLNAAIGARNAWSLRRLRRLVESRATSSA